MSKSNKLTIRLRSSDGHIIQIDEDLVQMSHYISCISDGYYRTRKAIPFNNIDLKTFELVFQWCEQHKYDMRGAVGGDLTLLHDWDQHFFHVLHSISNFFNI